VPADQVLEVAEQDRGRSFDAPGATFTHQDNQCTFEVLIDASTWAATRAWHGWPGSYTPPTSPPRPGRAGAVSSSASPQQPPDHGAAASPRRAKVPWSTAPPVGGRPPGLRALLGYFLGLGTWVRRADCR